MDNSAKDDLAHANRWFVWLHKSAKVPYEMIQPGGELAVESWEQMIQSMLFVEWLYLHAQMQACSNTGVIFIYDYLIIMYKKWETKSEKQETRMDE